MPQPDAVIAAPGPPGTRRSGAYHRRDIQGLRGLAVLLVVAFHAGTFVRGGFVGVDVFFVISGFVITLSLLRELERSGTIGLRSFYVRRIRRLLPALGLVIVSVLLISTTELDPAGGRQTVAETARSASLFVANLHLEDVGAGYFAPDAERNPLLHTWSLSIEEQFYLVLPPLMVAAWAAGRRGRRSPATLEGALVAVTVVSFVWAAQTVGSGDERAAFYLPHLRAWEFCAGALLALRLGRLRGLGSTTATLLSGAGMVLVVASGVVLSGATTFPGPTALLPVAGTAMIIAGGTAGSARSFGTRAGWLVWLGDRSYSWYLWHWPILTFAFVRWPEAGWARPVGAIVALIPAAASYAWVERPIRSNRGVAGVAAITLAGIVVVAPVAASVAIDRGADDELARRAPELTELTSVWVSGCDERPWPADRCAFGPARARGTVALLGDSHASVLGDVVTHVGAQLGLRTVAFTKAGCAAALVPRPSDTAGCERWIAETLRDVRDLDPDVVVVANRSPLYVLGRVGDDPSGREPIAPAAGEAMSLWTDGLRSLLTELATPTLLVHAVPEQPASVVDLLGTDVTDDEVPTLAIEDHRRRTGDITEAERRVVEDLDEALGLDPSDALCSAEGCPARDDGAWRYFDATHLTPDATMLLADDIRDRLRRLLSGELRGTNR